MSNNSHQLFRSAKAGIYQRITYPHLVKILPLEGCLRDLDLLSKSIAYSLSTPYYNRRLFHWPLLTRFICNEQESYISLVFKSPTSIKDLRVTYINSLNDLNLFPSLKEKVLSDLLYIARS